MAMKTSRADSQVSRLVIIVLTTCFGCSSTQSSAAKDAGKELGDDTGVAPDVGGAADLGQEQAGSEAARPVPVDPFATVELKPDTDTTPVASCVGQPDMTLCNVVTTPDRWYDICVGGTCVSPGCGDATCNAPAPHFSIPANSDHSHLQLISSGSEPIVADLVTGLHWQGCDAGRSGEGCATGTGQQMLWQDAVAYCDSLSWGGKDDWYLPDSFELMSIVDWAKSGDSGVTIDPSVFPHASYAYWTSHLARSATVFAIQFRFSSLIVLSSDGATSGTRYTRCVRRGFSRNAVYVDKRFADSFIGSEKIITDAATGLVWQGCSSAHKGKYCDVSGASSMQKTEWVAYCDSLTWAGFSDWRLPTYKELHSIAQYPPLVNPYDPRIDETVFDLDVGFAMGARAGWQDGAKLFIFDFDDSNIAFLDLDPTGTFPIMCVRGY
jgi:hypothetical protein